MASIYGPSGIPVGGSAVGQEPNAGRRLIATQRISAENLQRLARQVGRCGDIHPLTGDVCVTQPHDDDVEHMAVQIGGPMDGYVYATWGGTKRNEHDQRAITAENKAQQAKPGKPIVKGNNSDPSSQDLQAFEEQ